MLFRSPVSRVIVEAYEGVLIRWSRRAFCGRSPPGMLFSRKPSGMPTPGEALPGRDRPAFRIPERHAVLGVADYYGLPFREVDVTWLAELSPPEVANPSDNLKNLFEIPVLFYALALYLYVANQVDAIHVAAAWVFVAFRVLHSLVHCTINIVMLRFYLYLVSTLAVWFIAGRAALHHLA